MKIREAIIDDHDGIWEIFSRVIESGDTFAYSPKTSKEEFEKLWFGPNMKTFVFIHSNKVQGLYWIRANQPGLGSHIANAAYIVHPDSRGIGIGDKLCKHSLETAAINGFKAMQYNIVVSTNNVAVSLWQRNGFQIIGTIPNGFRHLKLGYVDAFIMYREL